jgi:streptomycin 6-kinase
LRPAAADLIARLHGDAGTHWLQELPGLVLHAERRWGLRIGGAYSGCTVAFAAPARGADGGLRVIKAVPIPEEARREAAALEHWRGQLAPRLLEFDGDRGILLLEAVQPGQAAESGSARDQWARIAGGVAQGLWARSPTVGTEFPTVTTVLDDLTTEIEAWSGEVGADLSLAEFAIQLSRRLAVRERTATPLLVHGDLHPGNLLWASNRGWVAIDPQPVVGDAAYDAGAVLRSVMPSAPSTSEALRAVRSVARAMELDEERVLAWGLLRHLTAAARWARYGLADTPPDLSAARALKSAAT